MNTMHPTFWRELDAVLTQLHQDGRRRVLVISSTGKHFSAGMALETFGGAITMDDQSPEGRAAILTCWTDMQATFTKLEPAHPGHCGHPGRLHRRRGGHGHACCIRYATPMRSSASRKSTSAWWPTWARCSACPS
jgi:enoyl-CoA hydratase